MFRQSRGLIYTYTQYMQYYRTGPRKQSFSPALNYEVVNYEFIINSLENRFFFANVFYFILLVATQATCVT